MEPAQGDKPSQLMIDATHLKARRTAASLLKKGLFPDVCDGQGRPLVMLLGEGQMSDYRGAAMLLDALPCTKALLDDQGYDADWFRKALAERNITACIPSKKNRKDPDPARRRALPPAPQDQEYVRQAQGPAAHPHPLRSMRHTFMSAICIAATIIFCLNQ